MEAELQPAWRVDTGQRADVSSCLDCNKACKDLSYYFGTHVSTLCISGVTPLASLARPARSIRQTGLPAKECSQRPSGLQWRSRPAHAEADISRAGSPPRLTWLAVIGGLPRWLLGRLRSRLQPGTLPALASTWVPALGPHRQRQCTAGPGMHLLMPGCRVSAGQ